MNARTPAPLFESPIQTDDGEFVARYSEHGLAGLDFPRRANERQPELPGGDVPSRIRRWHDTTAKALLEVLAGEEPDSLPPLDLSSGTEFQQRVWKALQTIGPGQTLSYAEVAQAIGQPKAVRAVGAACGANPIPVLVPCHRVLAAHHKLGGFSGGLHWKRLLLKRESVTAPAAEPFALAAD